MLLITFSKGGQEDIELTEDDLFDFRYEASCYSGECFELGGVNAKMLYLLIDNNNQRFSRGVFANSRVKVEINGKFFGFFNAELPKRRNGAIELTAYDDMVKLDVEFPQDYPLPALFHSIYARCIFEAGLADDISFNNFVFNGTFDKGLISHEYKDYIYANSCRNLVSGMAEWNGGFVYINDAGKLQVDKFSKVVSRNYYSGELMELDYSDETITFSKVKTSQNNKTYEMGNESGYTLVLRNQYISYGLSDEYFELLMSKNYEYYNGFSLTPMSFTLAEPDFELRIGDRVKVYDEEEQVAILGNVSKIEMDGNLSMKVTCGGFENVSSTSSFNPTSNSRIAQAKQEAKSQSQTAVETTVEQGAARKLTDVQGSAAKAYLAARQGVFTGIYADDPSGSRAFEMVAVDGGTFHISRGNWNDRITFGDSWFEIRRGNIQINISDSTINLVAGNGLKLDLRTGGLGVSTLMFVPPSGYGDKMEITLTDYSNESAGPSVAFGGKSIEFCSDGLYYCGRRLAFADELQ